MGTRGVIFPKASSAAHDRMVVTLARDEQYLLQGLRQAWPSAFDGAGAPVVQRKIIEYQVMAGGRVVGYVDLALSLTAPELTGTGLRVLYFYVEVKSGPGPFLLGELLRQIRFYQTFVHAKGYWTVVSPYAGYADILAEQGIGFFCYGPDGGARNACGETQPGLAGQPLLGGPLKPSIGENLVNS